MRFVNVAVSDVAALLGVHLFDSKRNALARIRRRGGIRWRRPKKSTSASSRRYDEFASLRPLPASRAFEDTLKCDPTQFADEVHGETRLTLIEDKIRADAMGMGMTPSKRWIASFVNTELGKALERKAMDDFEIKCGCRIAERQRSFARVWTHPRDKSIKVHLIGCVDATFCDGNGNEGVLEIKCRRRGFQTVRPHETIQLRTYLTLAKQDRGILLQSFRGTLRYKLVKRNDAWFYRRVKPVIDKLALQIGQKTNPKMKRRQCRSKRNA